ncbi:hypothetical protein Glove_86g149 [Diversispora epigaea]|uniref:Uncharacterized protein n=1 Tax=Diversispora epigaea TaxID=1348612 RepID=A0A397JA47_9GLOM|nr:hypothetical protein Glove_86g149 [Diversispora epigaea]
MVPEKKSQNLKKVRYTLKFWNFALGWELLFQKISYDDDDEDMNEIKEQVLKDDQEKITLCFSSQRKFFKIIIADVEIRVSLNLNLQKLVSSYPTDKSLTLKLIKIKIIKRHDHVSRKMLNLIVQRLNIGWDIIYQKDFLTGKKIRFKPAYFSKKHLMMEIADAQLHYAFSLLNTPGIKFDPKVFVSYLTKAANGGNIAAQYISGDMYFNKKIFGKKNRTKFFEISCSE